MKVLIADDSLVIRRLLQQSLAAWGYEVLLASDGAQALEMLSGDDPPHIAILDWIMPVTSGPEVCRRVREMRKRYIYLLLLTSRSEREDIVEGLGAGADDYITKPFDTHELEVRLRAGRRIIELQTELLKAQEALRDQATRDSLTRCWNRNSIIEILDREIHRSRREQTPLGLAMVDLDHFKLVNDTYGHICGDEVLRQTVGRIHESMRNYDSLGRYGGEEFLAILPGCDDALVANYAERIRSNVARSPVRWQDHVIPVTASFGVCSLVPEESTTTDGIILLADESLYEAKRAGRNRVVLYRSAQPATEPH